MKADKRISRATRIATDAPHVANLIFLFSFYQANERVNILKGSFHMIQEKKIDIAIASVYL